jgi:hypothetical protein
MKNHIETVGTISKKETLASLEESFCNGAMVIESKFPFPGYYSSTVPEKIVLDPGSVFLITKKVHPAENIMRINHVVKKSFKKRFDATIGEITVFNEIRPCIRVKLLKDYTYLPELIGLYRKNGIQFLKYRKVKSYYGLIKIRKYFILESPSPGLYMDVEQPEMCYFQIPGEIEWNKFEKITVSLKRNLENNKFDAAIGTIFRKNCLVDVVRIYDINMSGDELKFLKGKYLEAIKKS